MANIYATEKQIQNSILEFLLYKKIFCWRNNSVGLFDPTTGGYRKPGHYTILGVSDILGILDDGRFLAIEVKAKAGVVSENQKVFMKNILDKGGIAFVARSLENVQEQLKLYL